MSNLTNAPKIYVAGHLGMVGSSLVRQRLAEVGCKKWSPTDRVIYDLEDENGTDTEGDLHAGVSGGGSQDGGGDGHVDSASGEAAIDAEEQSGQLGAKRPGKGLIHHSDRGSQYCAHAYQKLLWQFGMQASMSRKGNRWGNAPMESCWGSLKTKLVHHRRFASREQAKREITEYIEIFYNRIRKQARLGHLSPAAFSQQYYAMQMAA